MSLKLPNAELAYVDPVKVTGYLLSFSHPRGKSKADFFSRFGFHRDRWEVLAEALRTHASRHRVADTVDTVNGIRYTVDGRLDTPDGRNPFVRVVWVVEDLSTIPRLITAYPLRRSNV